MRKTKKETKSQQRKEIFWNIINSLLAGSLVFLGSLSAGQITWEGIIFASVAFLIVVITKFKDFWDREKKEYCQKAFNFI